MHDFISSSFKSQLVQPLLNVLHTLRARSHYLRVLFLIGATIIFAIVSGVLAFNMEKRFVEAAVAGVAFFLLSLLGVEVVILAALVMAATLFNVNDLPHLFGFSTVELSVFFLLGLVIVNCLSSKESFVRTPLDWPIFLFVGAAIVSFVHAKYNLGTVSMFRNSVMRTMLVYLLFFAVTNLIKTRRQLMRLVRGMFIVATITAGFMVAQQAVGSTVSILPGQEQVYGATALGQELVGTVRLSSVGAVTICMMLFPALLLQVVPGHMWGRKWLSGIMLLLFPAAIAFTFDRNLWIGVAIASVILALIVRAEGSRVVLLVSVFLIGAILLGSLLNAYVPRIGTMFEALSIRFMSLFAGDELVYDDSTQFRLLENEYAMATIREYPLLGIGPGAVYRPQIRALGDPPRSYVHNAYLWLLVDFGTVGFLPFLVFSIIFLVRGISAWYKLDDPILRGLAVGFSMGYVILLVSSVAAPRLMGTYGAVLVGIGLGVNEVIIRLGQPVQHNVL